MKISRLYSKGVRHFAKANEEPGKRDVLIALGSLVWRFTRDDKGLLAPAATYHEHSLSTVWTHSGYVSARSEVQTVVDLCEGESFYGRAYKLSIPKSQLDTYYLGIPVTIEGRPVLECRFSKFYIFMDEDVSETVDMSFEDFMILPALAQFPNSDDWKADRRARIAADEAEYSLVGVCRTTGKFKVVKPEKDEVLELLKSAKKRYHEEENEKKFRNEESEKSNP